jgi:glycosyltransferase involved in cell wall biosynthesis
MTVYNGALYLEEAVISILRQTFQRFEFIIVDDGSTDATPNILSRYLDSRVTIVRTRHIGLTAALNVGLTYCKGDLIARMDADDIASVRRLEIQADYLAQYSDIDIICSDVLKIDSGGVVTGREVVKGIDNDLLRDGLLYRRMMKSIVHPTVVMRRRVIERLRGYREFRSAEDRDFWLRAIDIFAIRRLNRFLLKYRVHDGGISRAKASQQATSSCMSAVNYRVNLLTGVDLFEQRPDLFHILETQAGNHLAAQLGASTVSFVKARTRIRSGERLLGLLQLSSAILRHGKFVLPRFATQVYAKLVDELVADAQVLLTDSLKSSPATLTAGSPGLWE